MRRENCTMGWMATAVLSWQPLWPFPASLSGITSSTTISGRCRVGKWHANHPPGQGTCRRLVAALSGPVAERAGASAAKRSRLPAFVSGAAAVVAQRLEHFSSFRRSSRNACSTAWRRGSISRRGRSNRRGNCSARMQQLPQDRRRMVITAIRDLRAMPPRNASRSSIPTASKECSRRKNATLCVEPPGCRSRSGEWSTGRISPDRQPRFPVAVFKFETGFSENRAKQFRLSSRIAAAHVPLSPRSHCPDSAGSLRWQEIVLRSAAAGCGETDRA